jgi:hypothetical protein
MFACIVPILVSSRIVFPAKRAGSKTSIFGDKIETGDISFQDGVCRITGFYENGTKKMGTES